MVPKSIFVLKHLVKLKQAEKPQATLNLSVLKVPNKSYSRGVKFLSKTSPVGCYIFQENIPQGNQLCSICKYYVSAYSVITYLFLRDL